jgi:hypothetical protein
MVRDPDSAKNPPPDAVSTLSAPRLWSVDGWPMILDSWPPPVIHASTRLVVVVPLQARQVASHLLQCHVVLEHPVPSHQSFPFLRGRVLDFEGSVLQFPSNSGPLCLMGFLSFHGQSTRVPECQSTRECSIGTTIVIQGRQK